MSILFIISLFLKKIFFILKRTIIYLNNTIHHLTHIFDIYSDKQKGTRLIPILPT